MKHLLLYILFFVSLNLFSQEKTFNITRNTPFYSENGDTLSFEDFTLLTSKYKSKLLPVFDDSNKLKHITLSYPVEAAKYVGKNRIKEIVHERVVVISEKEKYLNNFNSNTFNSDSYKNVKELPGMIAPHF